MGVETNIEPYLSITLGSQEVAPIEMASAFGTLAADGKHFPHTSITKIVDASGETIFEYTPEGDQAISHGVAYAATSILKGVITGGTGRSANIGRPAAGKTGTTQDYRDAWFVGYTPQLSAAVWMGFTPERPMRNVHGRKVFGGTFAAPIWKAFMSQALANEPVLDFNAAPAPEYTWKKTWDIPGEAVPSVVGMSQAAAIETLAAAGFKNYAITTTYSNSIPAGLVGAQSPEPGAKANPDTTVVTIAISQGPDPSVQPTPPPTPPPPAPPETTGTPSP
jgi:membrane peptidoglycan carboxypeptidase